MLLRKVAVKGTFTSGELYLEYTGFLVCKKQKNINIFGKSFQEYLRQYSANQVHLTS